MTYNVMTSAGRSQVLIDETSLANLQQELARRGIDLERLKGAMETLAAVNEPERFMAAAMAVCNQLASRTNAERVSLGFLKGRYVRVRALSHTEKITRQMQLVQDIEGAMEECLDQDVEILFPSLPDAPYVARTTEKLSVKHGPSAVLSVPLRRGGEAVAVLTFERKAEKAFKLDEIETLRLIADLVTSRLVDLYEHDRWLGARMAKSARKGLALVLGPKHTWMKAAAAAILALAGFGIFGHGMYRVDAPFTLDVIEKRIISAPYDQLLDTVNVEPGDVVAGPETAAKLQEINDLGGPLLRPLGSAIPPTTLATLYTKNLETEYHTYLIKKEQALKQADNYRAEDKTSESLQALDEAKGAQVQADGVANRIAQAKLDTPFDGIVLSGDLKQKLHAQVRLGEMLFEVAPLKSLRAELLVPEDQIADIRPDARGELATASYPDQRIGFQIESIAPRTKVANTKNVFPVRVRLDETLPWMKPGMEGVAKVNVEQKPWAWLVSHRVIKWVRMKLWW
jgi:hypothetical protein